MDNQSFVEERTKEVLRTLNESSSNSQLERILKTYKYILQNINSVSSNTEKNAPNKKRDFMDVLYDAFKNNQGFSTSNSTLFKHLLDEQGIENQIVLCKSANTNDLHIANLVRVGEQFYYFDLTLEKTIKDHNRSNAAQKYSTLCTALGKEDYERFYIPVAVLRNFSDKPENVIPTNIANESIASTIVNAINYRLPDYSSKSKLGSEPEF